MKIYKFSVGALGTNSYLCVDEATRKAFLTDPGDDAEKLLNAIRVKDVTLEYVILTHGHFDHILALSEVMSETKAKLLIHRLDAGMLSEPSLSLLSRFSTRSVEFPEADILLDGGEDIEIGESTVKVIHSPGHTPGSVCLLVGDDMISGDTLFRESIGRSDFPGGSFNILMSSLRMLVSLDVKGKIYPGHGMSTTMAHELEYNTYLM